MRHEEIIILSRYDGTIPCERRVHLKSLSPVNFLQGGYQDTAEVENNQVIPTMWAYDVKYVQEGSRPVFCRGASHNP